jgi:phospholipase C
MRYFPRLAVLLAAIHHVAALPANQPANRFPNLDDVSLEALQALGRKPEDYREPGSLPYPHLPPGTDTIRGIKHIVILMMENHSFDNIIGMLGRGDGFTLGRDGSPSKRNQA